MAEGAQRGFAGRLPSRRQQGVAALLVLLCACTGAERSRPRHLIYLHGRIIQDTQDPRPQHAEFGHYEMAQILDSFRGHGFVVTGEIRPRDTRGSEAADRVVQQVRKLIDAGVPADHITVLGGSMGAGIALLSAARLQEPELRFALLGTCLSLGVDYLEREGHGTPRGHILAVRETSDRMTRECPVWEPLARPGLDARELVVDTGLDHGFHFRPLPVWVEPVVNWATTPAGD